MEKMITEYTDAELNEIELTSYRSVDQLQQELSRWQQNLQAIKLERAVRQKNAVKDAEKKTA